MASSLGSGTAQEDLNLNLEELGRLQTALQSEEFRKLLLDYVKEVNDPENRMRYEADVISMERERGFDVTFVNPDPGYVLKTNVCINEGRPASTICNFKVAFINVATSVQVDKPECRRMSVGADNGGGDDDDDEQVQWTIPHTFSPPREVDSVRVYDCVFNPETLQLANSNECFKEMIEEIAMDGIEYNFEVKLDRTCVKRDDKLNYKGPCISTIIRRPLSNESGESVNSVTSTAVVDAVDTSMITADSIGNEVLVPEHTIKYRHHIDMQDFAYRVSNDNRNPKELIVEVHLPLVDSSRDVHLDVQPNELFLKSLEGVDSPRYALELKLPCAVREDDGRAQFDSERKLLTVVLPTDVPETVPCVVEKDSNSTDHVDELILTEQLSQLTIIQPQSVDAVDSSTNPSLSSSHFLLPNFSCHQDDEEIVFVLKTENVLAESVNIDHLHDGMASHVRYCSVGSGGVVFNFALFLRFPCPCKVDEPNTSFSVNEDSVVVIFKKFLTARNNWNSYFYDTDGTHELQEAKINISSLQESLNALWNESKKVADLEGNPLPVSITEVNSDRIVIDVKTNDILVNKELVTNQADHSATQNSINLPPESIEKLQLESSKPAPDSANSCARPIYVRRKFGRSVSESSVDTSGSAARRMLRGILKYPRRVRTLSESSDDAFSNNASSVDYATMDSDIPEEELVSDPGAAESGGSCGPKKSVHFNNQIMKKLFRINSSIVGQRRKQRKEREQLVEQERRTSESECSTSEGESCTGGRRNESNRSRKKANRNIDNRQKNGKVKNDNDVKTKSITVDTMNVNKFEKNNGHDNKPLTNNNNGNVFNDNNNGRKRKGKPRPRGKRSNNNNNFRSSERNKVSSE